MSSYTSSATFYVTVTGLYGYSSPVTVTISPSTTSAISATINGSNSATVSPGQAVPVLLQGLGAATAAASAAANNLNFWCTDVIGSDANGLQVQSAPLCIDFNGATSSVSFSIPSAANGITIPAGGSTTIYGSVSTYGGAATPTITQSVSCPSGVFPCSASASVSAPSGGSVAIGLEAESLPVGTTYQHCFYANGQGQCLSVTVGAPGNSQGLSLVSANCSSCTSAPPPPLTTDNDGSTSSANYYVQCMNFSCTTASISCTVPDSQNISLTTTTTSTSASRLYFTISAVASTTAFAGTYAINCPLTSPAFSTTLSPGSLVVYDATPVITSVTPSTVTGGAANSITVTGHNFGNNPIVSIGGASPVSQSFSGVGIGSQVSITGSFQIPAYPAGTVLPVTVTSTGEFGNGFFQNPQNAGASNTQSNTVYLQVGPPPAVSVTSNGVTVPLGGSLYIDPSPAMPPLTVAIVDANGNQVTSGSATYQITTTFEQTTRTGTATLTRFYPNGPLQTLPANQPWNASWNGLVSGNDARLLWTYNGVAQAPFTFQVLGQNPDFATVATALAAVPFWMATNIAIHETNESQFCQAGRAQAAYCASSSSYGLPIFGPPGGYGIMQYDPMDSSFTIDQLWNWKSAIALGSSALSALAGPVMDTSDANGNPITNSNSTSAYPFWIRQVKQWQIYNANPNNPGVPIPPPPNQVEGSAASSCTFTLSPSSTTYTTPVTGVPNTYWFGDAILIKQYGGASTNYVYWDDSVIPSAWAFNKPNGIVSNIVYDMCTCSTSATCQHNP